MGLVEVGQLLEGVVADDVRVQDEKGAVVLAEDLFCELEGTGGTEGLGLDRELDLDVVLLLVLLRKSDSGRLCFRGDRITFWRAAVMISGR